MSTLWLKLKRPLVLLRPCIYGGYVVVILWTLPTPQINIDHRTRLVGICLIRFESANNGWELNS